MTTHVTEIIIPSHAFKGGRKQENEFAGILGYQNSPENTLDLLQPIAAHPKVTLGYGLATFPRMRYSFINGTQ